MEETIDYKKNSLNTFRLIAAISVLWVHALNHLELSNIPILGDCIVFFEGVPIFFTLSGFFIWHSIGSSKTFTEYAKKRFWRIYPELWMAVAVEIIVLLILYNQPINWKQLGLFVIGQATIFQFWTPDFLRGYGCGCPNGALWTIAVLIQFYFFSYFIYKWLHKKKKTAWGGVIFASIILGFITPVIRQALPAVIGKLYAITIFPYLWMFLISAFVAEFRMNLLPFVKDYWWCFIALQILNKIILGIDFTMNTDYTFLGTVFLFCGVVGFAYKFPCFNIKTDISYGVYIYHMTFINALMVLGFVGQKWTIWAVIIMTCLVAWVSTETIGRLSIKKKQSIGENRVRI